MRTNNIKKNKRKFITKGHGKEPTVIEFNLSKAVILLIIIGVIIAGLVTKEIVTTIIEANHKNIMANEELDTQSTQNAQSTQNVDELNETNGDLGYISSAELLETKTGVGPFDENDEPGNDSSEDNDIVRSFDQITWTYQLNFSLNSGQSELRLENRIIKITADLPDNLANIVEWDLESMKWLSNASISEDGIHLTGEYSMNDEDSNSSGYQEVMFVLKVKGAKNGTEIQPTFTFKLDGNTENQTVKETVDKVTVSATGKYNIQLDREKGLENKATVDYGEGEVTGRMYGYGFTVQLYNEEESKGLKGIEYPQGEISFDIDLKLERTEFQSEKLEDITAEATPILWNYRVNEDNRVDISGEIEDRDMYYTGNSISICNLSLPSGVIDENRRDRTTYNSGDIKINQVGSTLHITISNYGFDGIFPMYEIGSEPAKQIYTDNIGTFSVGYIQIFVPDTDASTIEDRNYYLTVSDNNMNIQSSTETVNNQMNTSDDNEVVQHVIYKAGQYNQKLWITDKNIKVDTVASQPGAGDGKVNIGDTLTIAVTSSVSTTNDYDIYAANKFIKFDGDAFEPIYFEDGREYMGEPQTQYEVYYVTKADGTNWIDQNEMNNANVDENMNIYSTIEEIPDDEICIGFYVETIGGYLSRPSGNNWFYVPVKVKDTAEIGKTYSAIQRTWMWKDPLDREIYTITNTDLKYVEEWPEAEWDSGNRQYIKTEYDENGVMVAGTHNGGETDGNTVLIVGANLHGNIRAVDENNEDKVNYDLGKLENIIKYSLEPQLDANENLVSQIEGVVLKAEVILPEGLSYELGSSKRGEETFDEPEIVQNEDGTTTLIWYINEVTSGQLIEPIKFGAEISNSSANGQQYETKFIISEYVAEGEKNKIGNSEINFRTSTEAISIINLARFRLYKEVEVPVIEKNGEIHYTITGKNNKDSGLPEFVLLDVMPYNGDTRGTKFNGTYTINKVIISQNIDGTPISNDNLELYITQDEQVKTISVKDENIGISGIWRKIEETNKEYQVNTEQANNGVTGIAIKGELTVQAEIIVDIYLTTKGNDPKDKYVNLATSQTQKSTEIVQTSQKTVQVIGRTISGKVWLDENYNNIIDDNEGLGELNKDEITLKLYKVNENNNLQEVTNVDGVKVEGVHPDETGYYEFIHLPAEDYIVKIEYNGEEYTLVEKEVGSNTEINSKFEKEETGKGQTKTITKLNSVSNIEIIESNINVGLYKKINLEFTKVAEEDHTNKIGGTEFKLYKLVCTEHEEGYHDNEQIDPSNVNSCWELVEIEESSKEKEDIGKVKFNDIQMNEEYRLVETKTIINRIKPEGQWKLKIEYVEDDKITPDKTMLGENIELQITSIGNPPAFVKENGELLLPNRALFKFPTSGSIGSKTIIQIGLVITTIGIIILISRKCILLNKKNEHQGKHKN